jgi:hypothetical protein
MSSSTSFDNNNNLDATVFNPNVIANHTIASSNKLSESRAFKDTKASNETIDEFNHSLFEQMKSSRRLTKANLLLAASAAFSKATHEKNNNESEKKESSLGSLRFNVQYDSLNSKLNIQLLSAASLLAKDSNGLSDPYVKIHLLPGIAKVNIT